MVSKTKEKKMCDTKNKDYKTQLERRKPMKTQVNLRNFYEILKPIIRRNL